MNPVCFENIIGITREPCECLKPYLPEGYDVSTSGLYMDELPQCPINLATIQSISMECDKDLAVRLTNARQQAYDDFKRDLFMQLQQRFKPKFKSFSGYIGAVSSSTYLNLPSAKAALVLNMKNYRGVELALTGAYINFSQAGTIHIDVYKQIGNVIADQPFFNFDLPVSPTTVHVDLKSLGFTFSATDEDSGKEVKYYFVYENTGIYPRNFANSCGCGDKESTLKSYLTSNAVNADTVQGLVNANRLPYVNGLNLELLINCGNNDIICSAMEQNEFIKVTIESCLQRASVINLLNQLLHSNVINRYTQANREQMYYDAGYLKKKYVNDVQWVAENMSMGYNDCYICQTENQSAYRAGILI